MATQKQRAAARSNVKKAQSARRRADPQEPAEGDAERLGKEAAAVRRGDSPTRKELEQEARRLGISGRSKMGKDELKRRRGQRALTASGRDTACD